MLPSGLCGDPLSAFPKSGAEIICELFVTDRAAKRSAELNGCHSLITLDEVARTRSGQAGYGMFWKATTQNNTGLKVGLSHLT